MGCSGGLTKDIFHVCLCLYILTVISPYVFVPVLPLSLYPYPLPCSRFTYPCRGLWATGRCGHSHWSSISSEPGTLCHDHSPPRKQQRSRWLSLEGGRCPASPPAPTGGTRSWSHTPSACWETLARWVRRRQVSLFVSFRDANLGMRKWVLCCVFLVLVLSLLLLGYSLIISHYVQTCTTHKYATFMCLL